MNNYFLKPNHYFFILFSCVFILLIYVKDFPGGTVVKNLPANAGDIRDTGSISGSGRSPGGGNGNPFQYFCLKNPIDRGAWRATVHGVTKCQTWPSTHAGIRNNINTNKARNTPRSYSGTLWSYWLHMSQYRWSVWYDPGHIINNLY